ncbi:MULTISPECIES: hypothetical protein [Sandaracinus]|uniref:hypothetical protein n=1 Tax=Sandaracinus TaxID=1055688 RepID=UPI0019D4855C|nr:MULTISPECIES: hypothetical protein [Sandaracinus]
MLSERDMRLACAVRSALLGTLIAASLAGCASDAESFDITQERCEAAVGEQNADPECDQIADPAGLCRAIVAAADRCAMEIDAVWRCADAQDDLCTSPPTARCVDENNAYVDCILDTAE